MTALELGVIQKFYESSTKVIESIRLLEMGVLQKFYDFVLRFCSKKHSATRNGSSTKVLRKFYESFKGPSAARTWSLQIFHRCSTQVLRKFYKCSKGPPAARNGKPNYESFTRVLRKLYESIKVLLPRGPGGGSWEFHKGPTKVLGFYKEGVHQTSSSTKVHSAMKNGR